EGQGQQPQETDKTIATLTEKRNTRRASLTEADAELRQARNSLNALHENRAAHQVRESQLQMTSQNLVERVDRRYHVDLRSFTPDAAGFEKILRVQVKRIEQGDAASTEADSQELAPPSADLEKIVAELTDRLDNM